MGVWGELLVTIAFSFVVGAVAGAGAGIRLRQSVRLLPSAAVAFLAMCSLVQGRSDEPSE